MNDGIDLTNPEVRRRQFVNLSTSRLLSQLDHVLSSFIPNIEAPTDQRTGLIDLPALARRYPEYVNEIATAAHGVYTSVDILDLTPSGMKWPYATYLDLAESLRLAIAETERPTPTQVLGVLPNHHVRTAEAVVALRARPLPPSVHVMWTETGVGVYGLGPHPGTPRIIVRPLGGLSRDWAIDAMADSLEWVNAAVGIYPSAEDAFDAVLAARP